MAQKSSRTRTSNCRINNQDMANILFSPNARKRFFECLEKTQETIKKPEKRLDRVIAQFLLWQADTIQISCDFDEMSFTFHEIHENGTTGICGGIIYHGSRDGFGRGGYPTFSVSTDHEEGYQIHT